MNCVAPDIDYAALSPVIALTVGLVVVVLSSVFDGAKRAVGLLTTLTFLTALGLVIWQFGTEKSLVADSLRMDGLSNTISIMILVSAVVATRLSIGEPAAAQAGRGDYYALMIGSTLGMVLLTQAENMLSLFIALELLSIPLYALCGTNMRRAASLEAGFKYLIVGSVGSATLLYGLAMIYGGSGATGFTEIAEGLGKPGMLDDSLVLVGVGMVAVGMSFKASIAPFHQWTPDVYQGAPTPITAFMAVATKAAALAIFIRFFLVALGPLVEEWDVMLAALAAISIIVGNVGALWQNSLKRMLAYSGIAQAGYMVAGIVVATQAGVDAMVFYLAAYVLMNLAAFSVVVIHERQTGFSDDIDSLRGLGRSKPLLAWPLTIAMLALAGLPPTAGFIGKLYLIEALVDADWTWLGVMIAVGTMISLAYYLRVVATVWMSPAAEESAEAKIDTAAVPDYLAGAPAEDEFLDPDADRRGYLVLPAIAGAALSVFFGVIPQPLVEFAQHAGNALAAYIT